MVGLGDCGFDNDRRYLQQSFVWCLNPPIVFFICDKRLTDEGKKQ